MDVALKELCDMQEGNEVQHKQKERTNELAKLSKIDAEIAKEKGKLTQTDDNEIIQNRIKDLESDRIARLKVVDINKEKL